MIPSVLLTASCLLATAGPASLAWAKIVRKDDCLKAPIRLQPHKLAIPLDWLAILYQFLLLVYHMIVQHALDF